VKKLIFLLFFVSLFSFLYFKKQCSVYQEIKNLNYPKNIKYTAIPFVFFPYYKFKLGNQIKSSFSYHCINIIVLKNGDKIYNVSGYGGLCLNEFILDNNQTLIEGDFF